MSRDPLGFFTDCARNYGDAVPLRFVNVRSLLLSHPEYVESVLVSNHEAFDKPPVFRRNRLVMGDGLLTTEFSRAKRQRKAAQPAFDRSHLASYAPTIVAAAEQVMDGWRDGEVYDIQNEMTRIAVLAVSSTLFGTEIGDSADRISAAVDLIANALVDRLKTYYAIPEIVPTPANLRLRKGVRELEAVIAEIVAARRVSGIERDDLLGLLLKEQRADPKWMSNRLLRDQLITFLLAGHETTALALTWTWYLLAQNPRIEESFHKDLEQALEDRVPGIGDRPQLRYTEAVFQEALRLYPPVWAFARIAKRSTTVDGLRIPKGMRIAVSSWVIHRDPRFFPDPERFDPDRWLDGRSSNVPKYAYFPFGGGPRACLGAGFSMLEGFLILATLGQKVRFEPVPDQKITLQPAVTLRPRDGILATVVRR